MALTKLNNNGIAGVTALPSSIALGDMVLVSSATASSSASLSFTLGDYKEYQFYFVNIHPSTSSYLTFQVSTNNGSSYGIALTSTTFRAYHFENGSSSVLQYDNADQANGTAFQDLIVGAIGTDNDQSCAGTLTLFNPSSTTYAKHYMSTTNAYQGTPLTLNGFTAGYFNTTSALTNIRFQMSSGNIDAGTILMYGIN